MTAIRPRTSADIDECVSALSILYKTENYPLGKNRDLRDFLTNEKNQLAWVAEHDGRIIGHISTSKIAHDTAFDVWKYQNPDENPYSLSLLSRLFVLPEYRKLGAAIELVDAAVKANAEDDTRLLLSVMVDSKAAIRLYEKCSWVRYGTTVIALPDGTSSDAICFAGPLPKGS